MLHVLPATKKTVQPYFLHDTEVRTSVVKRETSLFNSFCSNVSKQVACFFVARFTVA